MRLTTAAPPPPDPALVERDRLVMSHVQLVRVLALRLAQRLPAEVEAVDLIGVGVVALLDAAGRYRPATGVPFEAFARRRVQGAMLDSLRDLDWAPRSLRKLGRAFEAAVTRLRCRLGREPEEEEIAAELGMTTEACARALERLRGIEVASVKSFDETNDSTGSLLDVRLDPEGDPEMLLERGELRRLVAQAIDRLPDRERQIVAMSYEKDMTLAEIGRVLGICESRVSQLRALAVSRLRASLAGSLGLERTD